MNPQHNILKIPLRRLRRAAKLSVNATRAVFARPHPAPVFVLGHQKSGTTAIAKLMHYRTGLELTSDFFCHERYQTVIDYCDGAASFESVLRQHRLAFSRPLIKDPDLTFFFDDLKAAFPGARFVFIIRDPRQNIRSILNRLSIPGSESDLCNHQHLKQTEADWWPVLQGRAPLIDGANHIERLSKRWLATVDVYRSDPERMTLVRYEDFAGDKANAITELCESVGLEPRFSIADYVDRQFQPAGNTAVSMEEFFGEENLALIEKTCSQAMGSFAYA